MHIAKSLKKKIILYLHKKKVLACILDLITSLLKSRELANISKIPKNLFCFLLISEVTTLYIRRIPDIKLFVDVRTVRFYLIR
jgi:hypothetical protein